jgi:hypothetical protein
MDNVLFWLECFCACPRSSDLEIELPCDKDVFKGSGAGMGHTADLFGNVEKDDISLIT